MKTFLILVLLVAMSHTKPNKNKWENFKKDHRRKFNNPKEESFRRSLFEKRLEEIENHNERYRRGSESYTMDVNDFTDKTEEELSSFNHGLLIPDQQPEALFVISPNSSQKARAVLPDSIDWRNYGIVSPVKNQLSCGSCWAFSTTGAIEAHFKKNYGYQVTLSEQQLVDCDTTNSGCSGGWMANAYMYIARNGGVNYDSVYPYQATGGTCRYNSGQAKVSIRGYAYLSGPDENALKDMVATQGPVSVAIDASGNFGSYSGGVYYSSTCSTNQFTHAVVIVGYGSENGQDYWLVKNSWGSGWGDNGYIKMARNRGNHCGIASYPSYPVF